MTTNETKPALTQYGVWYTEPNQPDVAYWQTYDSLEDAVSENGDGTKVYKLEATLVGTFKRAVKIERVTSIKRKKKRTA